MSPGHANRAAQIVRELQYHQPGEGMYRAFAHFYHNPFNSISKSCAIWVESSPIYPADQYRNDNWMSEEIRNAVMWGKVMIISPLKVPHFPPVWDLQGIFIYSKAIVRFSESSLNKTPEAAQACNWTYTLHKPRVMRIRALKGFGFITMSWRCRMQ